MDRVIEKKKWPAKRLIWISAVVVTVTFVGYQMLYSASVDRLRVETERLSVSTVVNGEFLDYYPFDGQVEPVTTVYMDVEEGGRVEEILAEAGQQVTQGDLILRISNAALQRNAITTETALLENLDRLSNTQFQRAQSKLILQDSLLNLDYQILEQKRLYQRYVVLAEQGSVLSEQEFERASDDLEYLEKKRLLLIERIAQEDLINEQQLVQANNSMERLNLSLELLAQTTDSLNVRAPISGYLSSIDAELGESLRSGQRIGQVDILDRLKLRVEIDQYYLSKVDIGTIGHLELNQLEYQVITKKIYPEVTDDQFAVDMEFAGEEPSGLRRGQTLTVELSFSEPKQSLMIDKGGFYQDTGGRWAYLVSEDGKTARRTDLRVGRQNPRFLEVLEGLVEGDRIITSGYDAFNDTEELVFDEPF